MVDSDVSLTASESVIFRFSDDHCRSSGISLVTASLAGIVRFWRPEYSASQWHIYLIYIAIALLTCEPHSPR